MPYCVLDRLGRPSSAYSTCISLGGATCTCQSNLLVSISQCCRNVSRDLLLESKTSRREPHKRVSFALLAVEYFGRVVGVGTGVDNLPASPVALHAPLFRSAVNAILHACTGLASPSSALAYARTTLSRTSSQLKKSSSTSLKASASVG